MLHVLKSLAAYLEATTAFDVFASMPCQPNVAQAPGATPSASSVAMGTVGMLNDGTIVGADDAPTTGLVTTNATTTPYFQITWGSAQNVDGIRYYWPFAFAPPIVRVTAWVSAQWLVIATGIQLVHGWNTIRLDASRLTDKFRVQYVSGGADSAMRCAELEAYDDMRLEPAPADFGDGGFFVLHPDLDLSQVAAVVPIITLGDTAQNFDVGEMGNLTRQDRASIIVGLHCTSEDQLDRHTHWAKMILDAALAPDSAGTLYPGIPLRGIRYPLAHIAGGDWWSSGQKGWYTSPAPSVRVGGAIVAADAVDYWRGRVQMVGTATTADVRANFTCGVFDFLVKGSVRAGIESPAQILHRHNSFLILESDTQFHAVQDALV